MMRRSLLVGTAACALLVSGCSWFDDDKQPPLPGERISILQQSRTIEPDGLLASTDVRLPRPQNFPEWPQAGGYPDHALHHLALADSVKEAWRVSIGSGSGSDRMLLSMPIVAGDRIYAMDTDGQITALEASTGRRIWQFDVIPREERDPVVAGGIAFANGRIFAATGAAQVVALSAADGKELWRQPQQAPMRAAPTVVGDRIFVVTMDNQLLALAQDDGRKLWSHSGIAETATVMGGASPAAEGGVILAPFSSGELFALRSENGRIIWADTLMTLRRADAVSALADIRGLPVIDRNLVLAVSHSGRFSAIDMRSGNRVWDRDIAGREQPWVAGDWVYLVSVTGEVYCLSRTDGKVKWATPLPQFERPDKKKDPIQWTGPVLAGDRLILTGSHGRAISMSPYSGEVLGEIKLPGKSFLPPIVANQTLYFLTDDAELVAYR